MLGSTSWHCPICNQPCRLEELALDPRMQHILASAPYTDQVVVQLNGTFKLVEKKVESEDAKHRQGISRSQPYPSERRQHVSQSRPASPDLAAMLSSFQTKN
ncbi:MAG: hypothetical protein KVP17_000314 [Porospora cf. gigantea B]|uniref:uncharacterized protein n=1 Tax=Porospora cf. gigantea B TaxID=2853592 RepID=UPI0035718CEC|nr:MAG: hypothetical protein KVP17_000314 [Porospora cf. gigantea B]